MVTPNKGYGPPVWGITYISEVNIAKKVKSDAQLAMNKNLHCVQKLSLGVAGEDSAPTPIYPNLYNCSKQVELGSSYSSCRLI